jgi:transglutaminase-like putative cysteine protease
MRRKQKAVQFACENEKKTSYRFKASAGACVESFFLHALFLLAAYVMAQSVIPDAELSKTDWLRMGAVLAVLILLFELALPAVTGHFKHRAIGVFVRMCMAGGISYLAFREFCGFYLEHQIDIEDGLLSLCENFVSIFNEYYHKSVALPEGNAEFAALALMFCMMAALTAQYLIVQLTGIRAFAMAVPIVVLVVEMWVGQTPDVFGIFLFSAGVIFLATEHTKKWTARIAALALWILIFALTDVTFQGQAENLILKAPEYKEYQKQLESAVTKLSQTNLWGNRETVTNDRPSYSGKEILAISADEQPTGNLYLKSFVGTSYENGSWKEDTSTFSIASKAAGIDADEWNDLLWNTTIRAVEENVWGFRETDYTIRYLYNPQGYAYLPYFTDLDGVGRVSVSGDRKLKVKRGTKALTVHGTAWNDAENAVSVMRHLYYADDISDEKWDWYGSYVDGQYLGTSGAVEAAERLTKELLGNYRELSGLDVTERNGWRLTVAEEVAEYLSENYMYSWNLDTITDGTDPVEYFLTTGKKGYCMHFAAAGTLMLRELGIPARYAAGYVVKSSAFSEDEDGTYTATVLDRNAHAWTEIYLDNYGWVPIEMTPGYSGAGTALPTDEDAVSERDRNEGASSEMEDTRQKDDTEFAGETETSETESNETDTEETSEEQDSEDTENSENSETTENSEASAASEIVSEPDKTSGENETAPSGQGENQESGSAEKESDSSGNRSGLFIILLLVAAAGLAAIFAGLVRLIKKRIRNYHAYIDVAIWRKHYRRAVNCVNKRIYRKLRRHLYMKKRPVNDCEYEQLLCGTFSQITSEAWSRYMEIVKKAAFSGEGPDEEEAVFCREIYFAVQNEKQPEK